METQSAKQACYETLRHQVLTLQLEPGSDLDEVHLAKEFGLSRTPLREIIQRLAGNGYLTLQKNKGAKVASMDLRSLTDFFQVAPMIYAAVSRLAAAKAGKADIAALKNAQTAYRASLKTEDNSATAMHNHQFHKIIGDMADTPYLLPSLERLLIDHTRIGHTFYRSSDAETGDKIKQAADQHDEIIDAIEAGAETQAAEITLQHWALSQDTMERFIRPDPLKFELGELSHAV